MNLDAFAELPNGLHDARLLDVSFSPIDDELRLTIDAWIGDLAAADHLTRERHRRCTVIVTGVGWFSIHPGATSGEPPLIDVGRGKADGFDVPDAPTGTTMWWLYLQNRNSFLHMAGRAARLSFADGGASA